MQGQARSCAGQPYRVFVASELWEGRENTSMTDKTKKKPDETTDAREAWQMEGTGAKEVSIPAIRHVGPTLESDPEYMDLVGSGGLTPEAQIARDAATAEPDTRGLVEKGVDPLTGREVQAGGPERLKTRLPGDTSSDPHTDVGPDNATDLQRRGERKRNAA